MKPLYLLPIGTVGPELLAVIGDTLRGAYERDIVPLPPRPEPREAFDPLRGQFSSIAILHTLVAACPADAVRLLGVTECDLFIPMLSFVYGQAQLNGRLALLSVARLRQEFYGMPADPGMAAHRAAKETLHEMGHTFGLTHCLDTACPMALSTTLQQLDRKSASYCTSCAILLQEALTMQQTEEYP